MVRPNDFAIIRKKNNICKSIDKKIKIIKKRIKNFLIYLHMSIIIVKFVKNK